MKQDRYKGSNEGVSHTMSATYSDSTVQLHGEVFIEMRDTTTGEVSTWHKRNVITLDAGILLAMLARQPGSRPLGLNMLAVGTGATGPLLSPDAPSPLQRKLNAEIGRKPFSSTTFRDANGFAVAIPTNVVDFTATFTESEAVGPWNEMGLVATLSPNPMVTNPNPNNFPTRSPTVDVTSYDILFNYLTFPVLSKPNTATYAVTWRITF
jgi:hypothetical protein